MPLLRQETKEYDRGLPEMGERNDFGTITELTQWMEDNGVPLTARIFYAGCGSHNIIFVWEREATVEELLELKRERDKEDTQTREWQERGLIA